MEKFKEQAYIDSYNEAMRFERPTDSELSLLAKRLSVLGVNPDEVFVSLRNILSNKKQINNLSESVGIRNALFDLSLNEQPEVIVVWQYPKEIDKFHLAYLLTKWKDIWYPPSDEVICLYFPLVDKLTMITDYGNIYY